MFRPFRVIDKVVESRTITSFYLEPTDGEPLAPFRAGQFVYVEVSPAGQAKPLRRPYTLSSAPHQPYYRITVKRETPISPSGGMSAYLHDQVGVGDTLQISAPMGDFIWSAPETKPVVLLSGGVGITPMLSIVEAILAADSQQEIWFLHGSIDADVQPMHGYLRQLSARRANVRVHLHHSEPTADEVLGEHYDTLGRIDLAFLKRQLPHAHFTYYLCGPPAFMDDLRTGLQAWGVADEAIHVEYFSSGPLQEKTPNGGLREKANGEAGQASNQAYRIELSRTGSRFNWDTTKSSLLEQLEAVGVYPPSSCRTGTCLSCSTDLLSGHIAYDPEPFAEPFEGQILLCCARPESDLVLDL